MFVLHGLDEKEPLFNKLLMHEGQNDNERAVQCYVKVNYSSVRFVVTLFLYEEGSAYVTKYKALQLICLGTPVDFILVQVVLISPVSSPR